MPTQREKAERLRSLHRPGEPLVLFNVWDAVSARIIEELGFPAIATTSAGIAFLEGFPDGERIPRELMLQGVERVVRAVNVPVTADLEAGYGTSLEDAAQTAQSAVEAGAVGMNFEDAAGHGALVDMPLQAARIAAIRKVATRTDIPFVINARTDVFLAGAGESDAWRLEESIRRGNRYAQAGADSVFVPGVADEELIRKLVQGIDAPINILAGAATPNVKRLAQLGVARISVGSASIGYALAQFRDAARNVKQSGGFDFAERRISHADLNALFSDRGS